MTVAGCTKHFAIHLRLPEHMREVSLCFVGSAAVPSGIRRERWHEDLSLRAVRPPLLLFACLPGSIFLSRHLLLFCYSLFLI